MSWFLILFPLVFQLHRSTLLASSQCQSARDNDIYSIYLCTARHAAALSQSDQRTRKIRLQLQQKNEFWGAFKTDKKHFVVMWDWQSYDVVFPLFALLSLELSRWDFAGSRWVSRWRSRWRSRWAFAGPDWGSPEKNRCIVFFFAGDLLTEEATSSETGGAGFLEKYDVWFYDFCWVSVTKNCFSWLTKKICWTWSF